MSEQKLGVKSFLKARERSHRPQGRTERQHERGRNIEADSCTKPGRQRLLHLLQQRNTVPGDHRPHHARPGQREYVQRRQLLLKHHAQHEHHDAGVKRENTRDLNPARLIRDFDFHQRLSEMLTPNQDRVRNQTQGDHVHDQPAAIRNKPVRQQGGNNPEHPVRHRFRSTPVPRAAPRCAPRDLLSRQIRTRDALRAGTDLQPAAAGRTQRRRPRLRPGRTPTARTSSASARRPRTLGVVMVGVLTLCTAAFRLVGGRPVEFLAHATALSFAVSNYPHYIAPPIRILVSVTCAT